MTDDVEVQAAGFLLELSPDWIVQRASENVHRFLGASHVTLINEPLGKFLRAQPLHDLRNLFARLSGTTGVARAYRVRLTDEQRRFDVAFQLSDGRVLLEGVPCNEEDLGETVGTVGGLMGGLASARGPALLEGGARRMRALTGYDSVLLCYRSGSGEEICGSSRGTFKPPLTQHDLADLPAILADAQPPGVGLFPRKGSDNAPDRALLRWPSPARLQQLQAAGVAAALRVPFAYGEQTGTFHCLSASPRQPSFEVHAAAELFAQMFAMQLEVDWLRGRGAA